MSITKKILLLTLLVVFNQLSAQSVSYFIKYKNNVERSAVEAKIESQKILSRIDKNSIKYSLNHFAQNLGSDDENLSRIVKITFAVKDEAEDYIRQLQQYDNSIEYIQPSLVYKIEFTPNDSLLRNQWALEKIGAFEAWDITQGEDSIIVGVIDTGIDYLHPDIKNKIYINQGETGTDNAGRDKRTNKIDDDGNGFIDDFMGWDFTDRVGFPADTTSDYLDWDNDPLDENYHGTFVAGILGAETNNQTGIAGAAPNVRILNLRAFDRNGFGEEDDAAAAILYAVQAGAKVINMSWGDYSFSFVLRDVIRYAYNHNVVLVASAGNSSSSDPHYPSGYTEVISVGNTDNEDRPSSNSNFGSTIDLVAPGTSILSLSPGKGYQYASGTSASAPFVSAAAALILSLQNYTNEEVKQILKSTVDDIGQTGWDLTSGAGRLNMSRALRILSPARVAFNYPRQDFSTMQDTLNISVTVMSPYFVKFDLMYGEGLNPDEWTILLPDVQYQVLNEEIYSLQLPQLAEGEYTLRLIVSLNNGGTTEERVNFHIQRTAPQIELVSAGPVYYGNRSTIMAELITDKLAVTRMYYRPKGTGEFNFVSLDGFSSNNQFVKQRHYGLIPKELAVPGTIYEVYFEAENLTGLKSVLQNNEGNNFEFITDPLTSQSYVNQLPFSLPRGTIFENPVNFLSDDSTEILFDTFYEKPQGFSISYALFELSNGSLVKRDSLFDKIPVASGDFNRNGKEDLISLFFPFTYIDEQIDPSAFTLQNKFKNQHSADSSFYPVLITDLNNDDVTEIYSNYFSPRTVVFKINDNLTVTATGDTLENYSVIDEYDLSLGSRVNSIHRNSVTAADLNGDGIKEIWLADYDGDLISYEPSGSGYIQGNSLIEKYFTIGSGKILASGDYNGDGVDEIAVLYESNNIASYFFLRIFNFKNNSLNILYEKAFLNQSVEYFGINFGEYYQSLKFVDIDNDNTDELVLNIFPYLYIIKFPWSPRDTDKIIYFEEQINTEFIFSGDLNRNGVTEIALQHPGGYKFYEFAPAIKPGVPAYFAGYSLDSLTIRLQWQSPEEKILIYKGNKPDALALYDSVVSSLFYVDNNVLPEQNYYYALRAVNQLKEITASELSSIIEIYSHSPAKPVYAVSSSRQSVLIQFSERIKNTIESLQSFEVIGTGIPSSVTAQSQYSYLLSFNRNFPLGENTIIIKGLHDYYGSPVETDTLTFFAAGAEEDDEFFISSHEIINPYKIKIVFNLDVNESSVAEISNYIFEPDNQAASVTVDPQDKKIIYIELEKNKPVGSIGREYRLKIENVVSAGGIKINSGAGSYLVLTDYAENLSDVYVYPSPVKLINGNEKMMFANLPQKAKILILTLEGRQVINLEEKDGNGGVEYDLRDDSGRLLNSGIYIYRIVRLDADNSEVEEKIGKFAVIR
ncbi:MAG: S8 family serine peptidase [Ignavibacteriaceae bacterium]